ncbi:MAG TPA: type II secretion system F family protein [Caproiciproducens sp.]|nr:type II secretion system F family protein [Caproiciproducens sp.]
MEWFAAVCAGVLVYSLLLLLLHGRGEQADTVRRRLDSISSGSKKAFALDEEMGKPLADRLIKPVLRKLAGNLTRIAPKSEESDPAKNRQTGKLKKTLMQAGYTMSAAEFSIIRILVIVGTALLAALIAIFLKLEPGNVTLALLIGLFTGYTGMRYFLSLSVTKRRQEIEKQLPEVLDLLSVSVEAGLGFEQAIDHVTKNMEGPLIDELTVTYREMTMGRPRKDALILLGERCEIDDLKSFAGAVVQAGQLGISIKNVLQSQSAAMRQARKARIQEKASKISVKILIPMVMFIFPVIFIVLLGPAVLSIIKALG